MMRRGYVDGRFGQIHYQAAGAGRPLVLLHQAIMTSDQFSNVFAPLIAHGLRPIAIDMPGFGMSDAPDAPPTIADYATCVVPVLDALGIDRAAVAGHHTGGLVSTEAAIAHPDRIDAVILHGVMIMEEAEREALTADIVAREKAFRPLPGAAHMVEIARIRDHLSNGELGPERISDYVVQAMMAWDRGAYWYGHAAAFAYRHEEPLQRITQPGLILTNTGDMMHQSALAAHALRPDFAYAEIAGGGIDICDQDPQGWADAIASFLATVV
ncbi:alpha/beta hydrolase [Sphingobium sp. CR2-8]|uniref:alpha/beta fold hydrolase n=1 Tax=Sphingobium sp. CR2-8 TaxID=1306534 RepID=UPI002DBC9F86|nr:alpha/beta hydrolase [Sphingobium sp. CR2-8]MEC3911458.1 alpha/beta hydrolase [Sphingobium sp. CR2-8]